MEIKTKAYGTVTVNEEDIITFENGLIGIEDVRKFVLLGQPETNEILIWLQSIEQENMAFVVIQPRAFKPDYQPAVNLEEIEDLDTENPDSLLMFAVVTVPEDPRMMTANLKAPVIINVNNNRGKQIILNDDRYEIKTVVLAEK